MVLLASLDDDNRQGRQGRPHLVDSTGARYVCLLHSGSKYNLYNVTHVKGLHEACTVLHP